MPPSIEAEIYHYLSLRRLAQLSTLSHYFKGRIEWFMESQYQGVIDTSAFVLTMDTCFRFLNAPGTLCGLELLADCNATNNALQFALLDKHQSSLHHLNLNSHHLACAASSMHFPRLTTLALYLTSHEGATVDELLVAVVDIAVINLFRRHSATLTDLELLFGADFSDQEWNGLGAFFQTTGACVFEQPLHQPLCFSLVTIVCICVCVIDSVAGSTKAPDGSGQSLRVSHTGQELWQDFDRREPLRSGPLGEGRGHPVLVGTMRATAVSNVAQSSLVHQPRRYGAVTPSNPMASISNLGYDQAND